MFTVCPKCMLTLAVTANDLRMGQGYVRCGRCANVFNALLALSEEPLEDSSATPSPTPADRASSSQIAAALRQSPEEAAPESAVQTAAAPATAPAAELAVESSTEESSIENESNFDEGTGTFETIVLEGEAITQTEEYVSEASVDSEIAALTQRLALARESAADSEHPAAPDDAADDAAGDTADADLEYAVDESETDGLEPLSSLESSSHNRAGWRWIASGTTLLLLLALQVINHWRDALAASPAWNAALSPVYATIGLPLDPHWNVAAYDVRQQGAVADPTDSQIIRVRLSLANRAPRAQPVPLLRLTLLDRYGKRIGSSDLTPEQYWPGNMPPRLYLNRDERVDSEVAVRDPGAASASFELDVCLRNPSGTLRCAGDTAASTASVSITSP
jgi:predicted Zn finger-like uncharacterized protein